MYLITGASGFVGMRLVNALKLESIPFVLLSRKKIPGVETIICDLELDLISADVFRDVDVVIHLAGYAHNNKATITKKNRYKSLNIDVTERLANLASISGVKKFVFISSVKASGAPLPEKCMTESDQVNPVDEYGKSKRQAEIKLFTISKKSNMTVSIVRPALVFGPNVKGNLRAMMSGIDKGYFPPLPNIDNRRSMVHVDDLVRAIILIAKDNRANDSIFNVTDGIPYSSREIYMAMCKVLGRPIPKWNMPLLLFSGLNLLSFGKLFDFDKLFGDEYYSSKKLTSLGFKAKRSLGEMNETNF
jgi:UDP-glucose 4-epimerase